MAAVLERKGRGVCNANRKAELIRAGEGLKHLFKQEPFSASFLYESASGEPCSFRDESSCPQYEGWKHTMVFFLRELERVKALLHTHLSNSLLWWNKL